MLTFGCCCAGAKEAYETFSWHSKQPWYGRPHEETQSLSGSKLTWWGTWQHQNWISLFVLWRGKYYFRDTNMDARLHCVDLDTAYNQVQTKPPSRLFTIFKPDYLCQCNVSLKWPGGQKAGESLDVDPRVAKLVERRRHSLPRSPRGAAAQHGRGEAGDRDVLRVAARGDQANLRLSSHQLGLAVQHDWQVTLKFHLWKMELATWKKASFRQLRSQLNSLGTMLPTVSELQRR